MSMINYASREINCKLVYYGPGLGGKTTNLEFVYNKVAPAARGKRLAERLMREALAATGGRPVVLDAQSYLAGFYERLGFTATGPEFVEDGIPHIPMALTGVRPPTPRPSGADR